MMTDDIERHSVYQNVKFFIWLVCLIVVTFILLYCVILMFVLYDMLVALVALCHS